MANYRFYNGGDTINDRIPFDNPVNDIKVDNIVSYYHVKAPAQGFFEVPDMIASGRGRSFSNFDMTIMSKWGTMGVVRVDPTADLTATSVPTALNDEDAKELGDEIHTAYLMKLVQDYVNTVEEKKAQGFAALPAQGYTKHALKKLGIADPALTVQNAIERQKPRSNDSEDKARIKSLEATIADMQQKQEAFMAAVLAKANPEPTKAAKA